MCERERYIVFDLCMAVLEEWITAGMMVFMIPPITAARRETRRPQGRQTILQLGLSSRLPGEQWPDFTARIIYNLKAGKCG